MGVVVLTGAVGEGPRHSRDRGTRGGGELFVSIGMSGVVCPAAALVQYALARGAATLELNLDVSYWLRAISARSSSR